MGITKEPAWIIICNDAASYLTNDTGGAIYTLRSSTFKPSPQIGLEKYERVRKEQVKPLGKFVYKTSIDAMRQMGITIDFAFADKKTFESIARSKDQTSELALLKPFEQNIPYSSRLFLNFSIRSTGAGFKSCCQGQTLGTDFSPLVFMAYGALPRKGRKIWAAAMRERCRWFLSAYTVPTIAGVNHSRRAPRPARALLGRPHNCWPLTVVRK